MSSEVTIRFARKEDAPILVRFNQAMALETESKHLALNTVSAGVDALFQRPELGFYVVAEQNGTVAGSLMITTEWSDWRNGIYWWVQSVYVLPEFRRQGIYRNLYAFVKAAAENRPEVCGFRLYVEKDNVSAQRTYVSLGMVETHYRLYEEIISDTKVF